MKKTFKIKKLEMPFKAFVNKRGSSLEYAFQWSDEAGTTMIPVSVHGALKLAEAFRKNGYAEKR